MLDLLRLIDENDIDVSDLFGYIVQITALEEVSMQYILRIKTT